MVLQVKTVLRLKFGVSGEHSPHKNSGKMQNWRHRSLNVF